MSKEKEPSKKSLSANSEATQMSRKQFLQTIGAAAGLGAMGGAASGLFSDVVGQTAGESHNQISGNSARLPSLDAMIHQRAVATVEKIAKEKNLSPKEIIALFETEFNKEKKSQKDEYHKQDLESAGDILKSSAEGAVIGGVGIGALTTAYLRDEVKWQKRVEPDQPNTPGTHAKA